MKKTKKPNVVILGAGTGGTIVANKLRRKIGSKVNLTVIDPTFKHPYQPGYLFVIIGKEKPENLVKDSRKLLPRKSEKIQDYAVKIDTEAQEVQTKEHGGIKYDYLVIATGSRLATDAVDWWDDTIHHFYNGEEALRLYNELKEFNKGKIVISIADIPYKCPPAPIEGAFLIDDYYRRKKIRDQIQITYTSPLNRAFSIQTTNEVIEPLMKKRGIEVKTFFNTDEVDTEEKVVYSLEGEELDYDLLIMIPPHRGQSFIKESGLPTDEQGWVNVDRYTLRVEGFDNIYALGDATNLPISKAGSTAHHEAPIIAKNIKSQIKGSNRIHKYNGHVQCFFVTKYGSSMFLDFNYSHPPKAKRSTRYWWWFKKIFKPFYFQMVAKGYV